MALAQDVLHRHEKSRAMKALKDPAEEVQTTVDEAAECRRMVTLLDQQIVALEEYLRELRPRRERWAERLDTVLRQSPARPTRAGHGALRDIILEALEASAEGLTLEQLQDIASRALTAFNPKSLRQTLSRLRAADILEHREGRWRRPRQS